MKISYYAVIFVWILGLFLITLWTINSRGFYPTYPYAKEIISKYGSRLLTTWAQFDGVHYLTIADKGYEGTGLIQAFFPLYPILVSILSLGILNQVGIGILISVISFLASLYWLHKLILLDDTEDTARKTILMLLFYPAAFFFVAVYSESLFLLLVISSFYAARKGKWWLAGLLGLFSGLTRLIGVFLFPALLFEYYLQNRNMLSPRILFCFGPLLGLFIYMFYLGVTFNDPLLFYHVQAEFGANRTSSELVLLPQVFFRYIKMLFSTPIANPIYPILIQEFMAGLLGSIGLIIAWFKVRRSYVVFAIGAFLLPTLTGTFSSMPRYLLPIFPLLMPVSKLLPKRIFNILITVFTALLVYNLIRFTQGLWVA
jgi:Gpi18-like mannosyltransferase